MEQRGKKARLDSLAELKRLRNEGGTRLDTLKNETSDHEIEEESVYHHGDDDETFIEHDERMRRPPVFSFKPKPNVAAETKVDISALEGDDYFQKLMSRMNAEIDDDEINPSPDANPKSSGEASGNPTTIPMNSVPLAPKIKAISRKPSISSPNLIGISSPSATDPPSHTFPPTDPIFLSSEFVPEEGTFEINETIFNNTDWLDENELGMEIDQKENQIEQPFSNDSKNGLAVEVGTFDLLQPHGTQYKVNGEQSVEFYWIDAYEKTNGTLYLFGKVPNLSASGFVSCCVVINNMRRNLFFLPREKILGTDQDVTLGDVHEEITRLAATHRIGKFGCKKVQRKYAFEIPDMPVEADYIKMVYPFSAPALPKDLGGKSFSHVFGTGTNALELFLVKRKIMGPCWLRFIPKSTVSRSISWCKIEMEVDDPKAITPILNGPTAPPITVLSMSIRTIVEPVSKTHEVVAASGLVFNSVSIEGNGNSVDKLKCNAVFSVARETDNLGFTSKFIADATKLYEDGGGKIELAKNERALLSFLIAMIYRSDPDIIVGHNFLGFDLGVLLHRMKVCKVDFWSRLGRLSWSQWPKAKPGSTEASYAERQIVCGRLICDTYICAKDLIRCRNYSLQTLVETQLRQTRDEMDYERVGEYFIQPSSLVYLLRHCEKDAFSGAMLMVQLMVLPLTKQLTTIAGNLWSRTLMGGRAERNEFLLLHEFHRLKYICPDKNTNFSNVPVPMEDNAEAEASVSHTISGKGSKRKATYAGGLVLEPKKGLYSNIVLLLDFNSLYPSIIQEFNICFTTVERDSSIESDTMPSIPNPNVPQGVLPKILGNLVARRREIKKLMKDSKLSPGEYSQLHIRQQALKLTANSMYGCLGFAHSRFHARPLAMLITSKGREILQSTVDLAQNQCKLDVLYGDTDSVMVHTGTHDLKDARNMGMVLKKVVNEKYRLLEIELDAIFTKLLLLKKKKYAAVVLEENSDGSSGKRVETKGLDLVRRDWSALSVDTSNIVLEKILAENNNENDVVDSIHDLLRIVATEVTNDSIPLEKYIISKNLTRDPEQYGDAKTQPHVMVALRMKEKGVSVRAGDTIPYIVCGNAHKEGSLAEHAFHPDDVRRDHLVVDKEWYLAQQVHPCIARLCEYLPGTSTGRIAACLGLDANKYHSRANEYGEEKWQLSTFLSDEEKFHHCKPLQLACTTCNHSFEFEGLLKLRDGRLISGLLCLCNKSISALTLLYHVRVAIYREIEEYLLGWMECDDPSCRVRTRQLRVYEGRCPNEICRGTMQSKVSGKRLYYQLLYYRSLFDVDRLRGLYSSKVESNFNWRALITEFEPVRGAVNAAITKCSYPIISLAEIFSFVTIKE